MNTKKCHIEWDVFFIWLNIGIWTTTFWILFIFAITSIVKALK